MAKYVGTPLSVLLLYGLSLIAPAAGQARVRAWEGTITIPTYGWAEDINPQFWALEENIKFSVTVKGAIVYPYTMQDHLNRVKEDRTYKALFLENEYLKITCLPELGGRLHSVLDKTRNEEMFHLNRVIKPSMIAMRGAFISGGVEWNAGPQVHTVTILSPVNALIGKNADGSAYIEVSNLEKTLRTRWTVRVTLHPGRAYLDEQIRLFNPIDSVSPYYFWNCTAFPCRQGTRFIYPMTLGTDHNGVTFFSWPVHEGKDLSWLKNYETWASIFAVDCAFDFFGAYDVDADRGVVQVANHNELGGKKAWTWGTWDFGLVSQKNLTDEDGPYIEVQSGPLPTQSDYGELGPRATVGWQEWWCPVHGLGEGFEYATKDVAIQTKRDGGTLELRMIATSRFRRALCTISEDGQTLLSRRLDLSPQDPQVVALASAPQGPVDVEITTAKGEPLARLGTPLPVPKVQPPDPSWFRQTPDEQLTVQQKYLKGRKADLATDRKRARQYYESVLADDPGYAPALRGLGVLDIEAALYESAAERLAKAVDRNPGDGLSWFFLGVSHLQRQEPSDSLRCAYQAARCLGTASLGYDLAGRAYMKMAKCEPGVEAFKKAWRLNPRDVQAADHLLLALWAAGDKRAALKLAQERTASRPTDLIPRAVLALQDKGRMRQFVKAVRGFVGEVEFEMLQASLTFAELGLAGEAARLLDAVCVEAVPEDQRSPLPLYYLAYFAFLKGDMERSRTYLSQAAETYRDSVFPSRPEAVRILDYALAENPKDAYGHLHIGNLYAHLGQVDEAASHWRQAVALNPTLSVAWRNLGLYAWSAQGDTAEAARYYHRAIAARPRDQTLYRDLAGILIAQDKRADAITVLESTPFDTLRRADVIIMLAQAYFDEQQYGDTIELLESTPYFVNWEGQTITWDLFNRAHIERGKKRFEDEDFEGALEDFEAALTYPENIGVGRSNKPREAPAQYWRGKALHALGRADEARLAWEQGAAGPKSSDEQNQYRDLCSKALQASNAPAQTGVR